MRTPRGSSERCSTCGTAVSATMNAPTRSTLATVPKPTLAPSAHAIPSTAMPTQMLATPNESGECLAIPW